MNCDFSQFLSIKPKIRISTKKNPLGKKPSPNEIIRPYSQPPIFHFNKSSPLPPNSPSSLQPLLSFQEGSFERHIESSCFSDGG